MSRSARSFETHIHSTAEHSRSCPSTISTIIHHGISSSRNTTPPGKSPPKPHPIPPNQLPTISPPTTTTQTPLLHNLSIPKRINSPTTRIPRRQRTPHLRPPSPRLVTHQTRSPRHFRRLRIHVRIRHRIRSLQRSPRHQTTPPRE